MPAVPKDVPVPEGSRGVHRDEVARQAALISAALVERDVLEMALCLIEDGRTRQSALIARLVLSDLRRRRRLREASR